MIHTHYLRTILDPERLKEIIELAISALKGVEFDTIAVTGSSGLIFGGALSYATGKPLLLVRKKNDKSHSRSPVEGPLRPGRWLFVDDQVASGNTLRRVRRAIEYFSPDAVYVGKYTYTEYGFQSVEDESNWRSSAPKPGVEYDGFGEEVDSPQVFTAGQWRGFWGTPTADAIVALPNVGEIPAPSPFTPTETDVVLDPTGSFFIPFSDDPTVIQQGAASDEPTQSELYNDSAFRMGG